MQNYTVDEFVTKLIFAYEQSAECRYWWTTMILNSAFQELPRYEAQYLEDLCRNE
jgi:hypothetical protein